MKKIRITLEDLFELPTAEIYNPDDYKSVVGVSIDSRNVKKNQLFVAIKGEKFDGHKFIDSAIQNGASAVLVNKNAVKNFDTVEVPIIAVKDTTKAYGDLAKIYRNKLDAKVISITGSNGKTSTKEILATLLSEKFKVEKTLSNNNNHIGVPLTIFDTKADCEVLILEHGTNHFGEINYTANIAKPDIAVISNIGDSHLEFLIDRDGVLKEKKELLDITASYGGKVLINNDDSKLKGLSKKYEGSLTYGYRGNADIKGKLLGLTKEGYPKVSISGSKKSFEIIVPLLGKANAHNYLLAATIAIELGLTKKQILDGTKKLKAFKGRLELNNYSEFYLVNDTYNSNPASVINAIEVLNKFKLAKYKVLILGDMFELGNDSKQKHIELAELVLKSKINEILTIGKLTKLIVKELKESDIVARHFNKRESLTKYLQEKDIKDSILLLKGSRGMKMEEFVKVLEERGNK